MQTPILAQNVGRLEIKSLLDGFYDNETNVFAMKKDIFNPSYTNTLKQLIEQYGKVLKDKSKMNIQLDKQHRDTAHRKLFSST